MKALYLLGLIGAIGLSASLQAAPTYFANFKASVAISVA